MKGISGGGAGEAGRQEGSAAVRCGAASSPRRLTCVGRVGQVPPLDTKSYEANVGELRDDGRERGGGEERREGRRDEGREGR